MTPAAFTQPLVFEPIFLERIWGGRRLADVFGKKLPPHQKIGEAWEVVDRPESQSVVREGPWRGLSLHELWTQYRADVFGSVSDSERFPLLIKLLDAEDKLSLQVHPPAQVAVELDGEPKTEFWYVAQAEPGAELFVGLREKTSRQKFEAAIASGTVADLIHSLPVSAGDAMFLPAGRFHAIGAGNLLVEVQENSDSTYRVFDWNRQDGAGRLRDLHIEQALRSIDFDDIRPGLVPSHGEVLISNPLFEVQKWVVTEPRPAHVSGQFAIICLLEGTADCAGLRLGPGDFCLVPAAMPGCLIRPADHRCVLLRITIPANADDTTA